MQDDTWSLKEKIGFGIIGGTTFVTAIIICIKIVKMTSVQMSDVRLYY